MGADAPIPPIMIGAAAPAGALPRGPHDFFLEVKRNREWVFHHHFHEPGNLPRRAVPKP